MADADFRDYDGQAHRAQTYIFTGGVLPSMAAPRRAMQASSCLAARLVQNIGPLYALTLAQWRATFRHNLDAVRALGFDQRCTRVWDFYLAAYQALFAARTRVDLQPVLARTPWS